VLQLLLLFSYFVYLNCKFPFAY